MNEKLLSVAEAADVLGVHRTRVNQLIGSGDLPATRIGRAYVIREADLESVKSRASPGRPTKAEVEENELTAGAQTAVLPKKQVNHKKASKANAPAEKATKQKAKRAIKKVRKGSDQ